jgi:1,4-dihydroxy-6-naphthoate synthase
MDELPQKRLAIPGKHTSAYAAFSLLYGHPHRCVEMPSSEILQSVIDGHCDAGLVIHEGRDGALRHGLFDIADIGDLYQSRCGAVLPLGVIVARRSLGEQAIRVLGETLRRSIQEARTQSSLSPFVCVKAQEQSPEILWKHINRYVTTETEMMTEEAARWIQLFLEAIKRL